MYIDLGQDITIFDKFNLSFEERSRLVRLANQAFNYANQKVVSATIVSFIEDKLIPYARSNKKAKNKSLEVIDYILSLCRNEDGEAIFPKLSKQLSDFQTKISGGAIHEDI